MTIQTVSTAEIVAIVVSMDDAEKAVAALNEGWWGKLAAYVHQNRVNGDDSAEQMAELLKSAVESAYKNQTGKKKMPGAYRSAKSILCGKHSALSNGLSLLNAEGDAIIPKSELDKQLAELKDEKSTADKIEALATTISALLDKKEHGQPTVDLLRALMHKAEDAL